MRRKFQRYKPEKPKTVRQLQVYSKNPTQAKLTIAWNSFHFIDGSSHDVGYQNALSSIKDIDYSAKDVERFALQLYNSWGDELFGKEAGIFLSALANSGKEQDYRLFLEHIDEQLCFIGLRNTKHINVSGCAGNLVGYKMASGTITVDGNVLDGLGDGLEGGKIIVHGTVGGLGENMRGGEIHLEAEQDIDALIKNVKHGKIFHMGKLIVDK